MIVHSNEEQVFAISISIVVVVVVVVGMYTGE